MIANTLDDRATDPYDFVRGGPELRPEALNGALAFLDLSEARHPMQHRCVAIHHGGGHQEIS
jgi:hypothetical protein